MGSNLQIEPSASELLFRVNGFIAEGDSTTVDHRRFNQLALALFAFQFANVPIYGQFCEKRGVRPDSIQHWSQIPALPTAAFKEHTVSSLPENDRDRVFHSSGTTGHIPSRHFHNAASLAIYEASLLPWFERHFLSDNPNSGAQFIFLSPTPALTPHSSLVHMFQTVRQKFGGEGSFFAGTLLADGSWKLEFDLLDSALRDALVGNRPVFLLGTAFSFVQWFDHMDALNRWPLLLPGSRILETGGYKGRSRAVPKAELRRLMTRHFRVPDSHIVTEYGMSELSSQAYDRAIGKSRGTEGLFEFPPWVRTQIISPETGAAVAPGETGLLRIFDLANIHSVMAIQTEDLARQHEEGFELIGRVENADARGCSLLAAN